MKSADSSNSHVAKKWQMRIFDEGLARHFEEQCRVSSVAARLLTLRGLKTPEECTHFLENKMSNLRDPELLPGCAAAADALWTSVSAQEKIVVYGDYDADGMTSTAILVSCLEKLGADVKYFVPNRLDDGYGLGHDALEKLAAQGANTVVTVDCGIASIDHAQTAKRLGLKLVITDHHQMGDQLPEAVALVHPRLPGHDYPFGDLCGAGVAFKVAWRLCQLASGENDSPKVAPHLREFLFQALALAAIGTVADVVSLVDENRTLVAHGLHCLKQKPPVGLANLMEITKLDSKSSLSSEDIGFTLGPRLNAAGRLGQARLGVELLLTKDPERGRELAAHIHKLNTDRDSIDRSIYRSASDQIKNTFDAENDAAFVLADRSWHAGVIGIVAGRLAEKYHRPTILIAMDPAGLKPGTGSARTISGVDLYQTLSRCSEHLDTFGGHKAAAGLRISEDRLEEFREAFLEEVAQALSKSDRIPELEIDSEVSFSELNLSTLEQMERLAPFGQGNPRPILCTRGVELVEPPKRMGAGERHLSVNLQHRQAKLRAVAFGKGEWAENLAEAGPSIDVAFRPVVNEFRGFRKVELHLLDWRISAAT